LTEELRPPHFINGLVGMLQNVELVIHDPAVHSPLGHAVREWPPHIHARRRDALPLGFTPLRSKKLIERFLLAILPEPHRFAGLPVADHGDELPLLAEVDLVHTHLL
jgi:hypothetical protein